MDLDVQIALGSMFILQMITFVYVRLIYLRIEYPEDRQFDKGVHNV